MLAEGNARLLPQQGGNVVGADVKTGGHAFQTDVFHGMELDVGQRVPSQQGRFATFDLQTGFQGITDVGKAGMNVLHTAYEPGLI